MYFTNYFFSSIQIIALITNTNKNLYVVTVNFNNNNKNNSSHPQPHGVLFLLLFHSVFLVLLTLLVQRSQWLRTVELFLFLEM